MKLKQRIARFIFKSHGWKLIGEIPPEVERCVFVFAPHTSNWDFYHGILCIIGWGIPVKAAIKKFWTKFPFSLVIKPIGGVGVDRSKKDGTRMSQVESMAKVFEEHERIAFVVTPEGSRSKRTQWKTGFYYIAKAANVPMVIFSGDFHKKTIQFGPVYTAADDLDTVMRGMMKFYKNFEGKYPEEFSLDERYI